MFLNYYYGIRAKEALTGEFGDPFFFLPHTTTSQAILASSFPTRQN